MIPEEQQARLRTECERIEDMIEGLESHLRAARTALRDIRRQLDEETRG